MELTKDKVVLRELRRANLLLQGVATGVYIDKHALLVEDGPHLLGVVEESLTNRDNNLEAVSI